MMDQRGSRKHRDEPALLEKLIKKENERPNTGNESKARFRTFTTELVTNYLILYLFNLNKVSNCIFILKGIGVIYANHHLKTAGQGKK